MDPATAMALATGASIVLPVLEKSKRETKESLGQINQLKKDFKRDKLESKVNYEDSVIMNTSNVKAMNKDRASGSKMSRNFNTAIDNDIRNMADKSVKGQKKLQELKHNQTRESIQSIAEEQKARIKRDPLADPVVKRNLKSQLELAQGSVLS